MTVKLLVVKVAEAVQKSDSNRTEFSGNVLSLVSWHVLYSFLMCTAEICMDSHAQNPNTKMLHCFIPFPIHYRIKVWTI